MGNPEQVLYDGQVSGDRVIVDDATYTPFGEIQTRRLGSSFTRFAYHGFVYEEGTRRLVRATFDREASVSSVADVRYTYDDAGNVLSVADVPDGLGANHELQCFSYDILRRLAEAWAQGDTSECASGPSMGVLGGPAPYWHTWDHDPTGNRISEVLRAPGEVPVTRTYHYPDRGQPQPHTLRQVTSSTGSGQASFGYDEAGNTVSRQVDGVSQDLSWDAEGNLEGVEVDGVEDAVRMVYDVDGVRLIRDDGDSVTAFMPNVELTWDRGTGDVEGTRYFVHAGQVVATCSGTDVADWTFLGVDHHGTTTTHAVNAFTAVEQVRRMDPYGNPRGPAPHAWPGQQSFVGGIDDETIGLIHIGALSYDPATGRFLSVDLILGVTDDQQIHGYAYAHNNPVTWQDPTGLCAPDAYSFCPNYDISKQPIASGGGARQTRAESGPSTVDAARDYFFGEPPPNHVRAIINTNATAPGNGVIIVRLFISDETVYHFGDGDGRDFSTDIEAGYRVVVAWDTRNRRGKHYSGAYLRGRL